MKKRRARLSTKRRKQLPTRKEVGIKSRQLGPASIRARWGMTSPIHPIIPPTATEAAVSSVAAEMKTALRRTVSSPMAWASSSPKAMALSCQRSNTRGRSPNTQGGSSSRASFPVTEDRPPISQYVISGSFPKGSATYLPRLTSEEKSVAMTMPASTRTNRDSLPRLTSRQIA